MEKMDTTSHNAPKKTDLVLTREANEWGQISDLEKNATYFVIRKPTKELTQQRSREMIDDVKAFLHEHRVLSQKQVDELNARYGEPAKAKAKELRDTMEKKFDEISKEFETRVEQLEAEYKARFGKDTKSESSTKTTEQGETPGEMPRGDMPAEATATSVDKPKASTKKATPKKE